MPPGSLCRRRQLAVALLIIELITAAMSSSDAYFTPASASAASEATSSAASTAPIILKRLRRPTLSKAVVLHLVARRYGSITDFSQIVARLCDMSRATGIHEDTIRKVISRYHANGNRYVKARRAVHTGGTPSAFSAEV